MQNLWNLTALGATWLMSNISNLYQKWVNGEELTEAEHAVLAPVIEGYCDQNDIAEQWSGEPFAYAGEYVSTDFVSSENVLVKEVYNYTADLSFPVCGYYRYGPYSDDYSYYCLDFLYLYQKCGQEQGLRAYEVFLFEDGSSLAVYDNGYTELVEEGHIVENVQKKQHLYERIKERITVCGREKVCICD